MFFSDIIYFNVYVLVLILSSLYNSVILNMHFSIGIFTLKNYTK